MIIRQVGFVPFCIFAGILIIGTVVWIFSGFNGAIKIKTV